MSGRAPDNMNETSGGVAGRNTLGAFRCREEREPVGFASFHQPAPLGVDEQLLIGNLILRGVWGVRGLGRGGKHSLCVALKAAHLPPISHRFAHLGAWLSPVRGAVHGSRPPGEYTAGLGTGKRQDWQDDAKARLFRTPRAGWAGRTPRDGCGRGNPGRPRG